MEREYLFDVGVQAQMNRAGMGSAFDHGFLFVGVFAVGHGENDFKLADAPGVRAHGFGDFDAGSGHVHIVHFAVNADDGHGAAGQRRGAEIRGRKTFALAVVVHGGVGDEARAAGGVNGFDTKVAMPNSFFRDCTGNSRKSLPPRYALPVESRFRPYGLKCGAFY